MNDKILLAHGSGGRLMRDLIEKNILPKFENPYLSRLEDQAVFEIGGIKLAFTTDTYVVDPIFFPGGDIGSLAIFGTINDLCMSGARPLYLSVGLIIEEGFGIKELERILLSMKKASAKANVLLVTGDTKVVEQGGLDKIFINTSGIGVIPPQVKISEASVTVGDRIIISGPIASHGIAILSRRTGVEFEIPAQSDSAPLNFLVQEMIEEYPTSIHAMRDPTRGGLASALCEICEASNLGAIIYESKVPILESVESACELLGLDPFYLANEGILIAFVAKEKAEAILKIMKKNPQGKMAQIIGEVVSSPKRVILKTKIGGARIIDMLQGDQLPRIC